MSSVKTDLCRLFFHYIYQFYLLETLWVMNLIILWLFEFQLDVHEILMNRLLLSWWLATCDTRCLQLLLSKLFLDRRWLVELMYRSVWIFFRITNLDCELWWFRTISLLSWRVSFDDLISLNIDILWWNDLSEAIPWGYLPNFSCTSSPIGQVRGFSIQL